MTTLAYRLSESTCGTHISIYSNYGQMTVGYCAHSTPIASVRFHDILFISATYNRFVFNHNGRRQVVQRNTFHRNADCRRWNVNCFAGVPCGEVSHYVNLGSITLALQHNNYAKLGLSYIYNLFIQMKTSTYEHTIMQGLSETGYRNYANFLNNQESKSNKVYEWEMWAAGL